MRKVTLSLFAILAVLIYAAFYQNYDLIVKRNHPTYLRSIIILNGSHGSHQEFPNGDTSSSKHKIDERVSTIPRSQTEIRVDDPESFKHGIQNKIVSNWNMAAPSEQNVSDVLKLKKNI